MIMSGDQFLVTNCSCIKVQIVSLRSFTSESIKKSNKKEHQKTNKKVKILEVFDNGTVAIQKGAVRDTFNSRRIIPFHEKAKSNHGGECSKPTSKTHKGRTGV